MKNSPAPKSVRILSLVSLLLCVSFLAIAIISIVQVATNRFSDSLSYLFSLAAFDIMFIENALVLVWTLIFSIVLLARKNTTVAPAILMAIIYPFARILDHVFGWALRSSFYWDVFRVDFDNFDAIFRRLMGNGMLFFYDFAGALLYLAFMALFIASVISAVAGGYNRKLAAAARPQSFPAAGGFNVQSASGFGPAQAAFPAQQPNQPAYFQAGTRQIPPPVRQAAPAPMFAAPQTAQPVQNTYSPAPPQPAPFAPPAPAYAPPPSPVPVQAAPAPAEPPRYSPPVYAPPAEPTVQEPEPTRDNNGGDDFKLSVAEPMRMEPLPGSAPDSGAGSDSPPADGASNGQN